jgi:glyoxylase-like metal-dependent hydrolase (beta-lactamase superfamily II)/cell division septum initiation protein DivIVA
MPDKHSAASEHAIMQQITQPLADLSDDPVGRVASVEFPIALRGYEREVVDEYVKQVTRLVAELHATRSSEGAVRRALERVGEQVSDILGRAHETAEEITSQSRAEAEERLMRARSEAEILERDARGLAQRLETEARELAQRLETEARQWAEERERSAERRVRDLDAEVDRIWSERDRIVADTRRLSEELAELASAASTRFPAATTDEAPIVTEEPASPAQEETVADAGGLFSGELDPSGEVAGLPVEPAPRDEVVGFSGFSGDTEEHEAGLAGEREEPPSFEFTAENEEPLDFEERPEFGEPPEFGFAPRDGEQEISVFALRPADEPPAPEQPTTVLRASDTRLIDLLHLGRERVIGCWQVNGVLIDPGPASCLDTLLEALGEDQPEAVLLTHIHLDHAGATGSLVARWPELEVYVHERGASHMSDPTRLLESAQRLYGDDMDRLWGEFLAVPERNLRVLKGGEQLFGRRFEVAYTPGHASHHVCYLYDDGTAFVGDVGGVRITPNALTIPPTPPPDIDIEAWHASIERVLDWDPVRLAMTHFGASNDVEEQLAELSERLDTWAALVRTEELESFVRVVQDEIERGASPELRGSYVQAAPPAQLYAGLERYWSKRETDEVPTAKASTHAGKAGRAKRWSPPSE